MTTKIVMMKAIVEDSGSDSEDHEDDDPIQEFPQQRNQKIGRD